LKNYTAFLYGNYRTNALKVDAVPSIFKCQDDNGEHIPRERISSTRRSRKRDIEEVLASAVDDDVGSKLIRDEGIESEYHSSQGIIYEVCFESPVIQTIFFSFRCYRRFASE